MEGIKEKISQLREKSSKPYHVVYQIPVHCKSNELSLSRVQNLLIKDIEKKTWKPLINIIHVHNQLRKHYYPTASENAKDSHRKRRMRENKCKSKKRKQETLVRNSQASASLLTGSAAEDRFSVSNPSKITKAELTALNAKTLTPRKHLEPLKYLLENNYFHEDLRECILNILSNKGLCKIQKMFKDPKKLAQGAKIPI